MQQASDAAFLLDSEGYVLEANPAFLSLLRYSQAEVSQLSIFDIVADERQNIQKNIDCILLDESTLVRERTFRCADQSLLHVEIIATSIEIAGERAISVIAREIAEGKHTVSEQDRLREAVTHAAAQWRHTFDAIASPVLVLDGRLTILRLNAAARDYLKSDFASLLNTPIPSAPARPWLDVASMVRAALATQEAQTTRSSDPNGRQLQITATPGSGNDDNTVVLMHDITDLHELQESLRRSEIMSAMGSLVAGVAHEVRNPLFSISALIETFELKFGFSPEQMTYISHLRRELDRLNRLMNDLLAYGKATVTEKYIADLLPLVHTAIDLNGPLLREREVTVDFEPPASAMAVLDSTRMVDALRNLIENAAHHSPAGGVVEITVAGDSDAVTCRVRDHGEGFSDETLRHAFEPFFSRRSGGTGLGLPIVQRVLLEHGGTVKAANHPGGGAIVTLTIPTPGPGTKRAA